MGAGTTSTLNPWVWSVKVMLPMFVLPALGMYKTFAGVLALFIFYWALGTGNLAIPPPGPRSRKKVFVIGLSRTGTTSLTAALTDLGYNTYHLCGHLLDPWPAAGPKVQKYWADAYDAHSDITATLVYKELADMYPDARFVLTWRDPAKWGAAFKSFSVTQHNLIKHVKFPPSYKYAEILYGPDWETMGAEDFERSCDQHQKGAVEFFNRRGEESRLLVLNVTGGEGWKELCGFLKCDPPKGVDPAGKFPNVDVFDLTRFYQPKWQVTNLVNTLLNMVGVTVDK